MKEQVKKQKQVWSYKKHKNEIKTKATRHPPEQHIMKKVWCGTFDCEGFPEVEFWRYPLIHVVAHMDPSWCW